MKPGEEGCVNARIKIPCGINDTAEDLQKDLKKKLALKSKPEKRDLLMKMAAEAMAIRKLMANHRDPITFLQKVGDIVSKTNKHFQA